MDTAGMRKIRPMKRPSAAVISIKACSQGGPPAETQMATRSSISPSPASKAKVSASDLNSTDRNGGEKISRRLATASSIMAPSPKKRHAASEEDEDWVSKA